MLKKIISIGELIGIYALIAYASLTSGDPDAPKLKIFSLPHFDKVVHFIMYLVLSIAIIRFFRKRNDIHKHLFPKVFILAVTYGGLMEILQHYCTQNRQADWLDMLANTLGVISGYFLMKIIFQNKPISA
ncbi:MAG: VanZ family protein [Bacteroidales bacterium]|nr:VanZ family protein [Bacteroidales bacterium]